MKFLSIKADSKTSSNNKINILLIFVKNSIRVQNHYMEKMPIKMAQSLGKSEAQFSILKLTFHTFPLSAIKEVAEWRHLRE